MIIEYIRYKIPGGETEKFLADYKLACVSLEESAVCLGYEITHCEEDREQFIVRIKWTSTADHLNVFRKSAEFKTFFQHIQPYLKQIEEMRHYQLTPLVWKRA
jgi:quinol monooxygenase YgiN